MKRFLYNLLPNFLKERLKLWYYNSKNKEFTFDLYHDHYRTNKNDEWEVITTRPLYFIVKDMERYEKYYKIKQGDQVFDAGANEGALSVVYSQKTGANGKVFAFEPDSINIKALKQNLSLNKKYKNVEIIEKPLWCNEDTITFYEAGSVASSMFYEEKNSKEVTLKATSIDNFISVNNLNRLNFIKMDIEGAEIEALEGAVQTIQKFQPEFAIASYHIIDDNPTYIALEAFFNRIGCPYRTEFFEDGEIMTYAGNSIKPLEQ
jgi:FkbM family methyltransferase